MNSPHDSATKQLRSWLSRSAVMFGLYVLVGPLVLAESPRPTTESPRPTTESPRPTTESPQPVKISSLPQPPDEIAAQLREGKVQLTTGELPADHVANLRGLAAQTDYEINFTYRCQPQWQYDAARGTVRIRMNFTRIKWEPKHTVWFRNPPQGDRFWNDSLVQHEFDHIRLSADPRMKKRFIEILRSQRIITPSVEANRPVNRALIDRLVGEHVAGVFQQITELIDIRYRELDRVTRHGRQPVPQESTVEQWLKPEN